MKKTKTSLRRSKLGLPCRRNAIIVRAVVIHEDVIGIASIDLDAIIRASRQILRQRLSILSAQMPGSRRWIDSRAKASRDRSKTASKLRLSRNSAKESSRYRAKVSDSCATRSGTSCRRRRIFSLRQRSFAVLLCATVGGFTAKHGAAAAAPNWSSYSGLTATSRRNTKVSAHLRN